MTSANITFAGFLQLLIDSAVSVKLAVSLYTNMNVENSSSYSGKLQWPVKEAGIINFMLEVDSVFLLFRLITDVS